nr:major capsid protein [Myoviridae environmental samples]
MGGSADDIWGVQPMTGPTGLIFAMRARYANQTGTESFYNEVDTSFSTVTSGANTLGQKHVGGVPGVANNAEAGAYNFGSGMATANAEAIGISGGTAIPEMAFSIEKVSVTAKSRALKAEYTMELAQDLKAIHGLDAETELSNILTTEIMLEINREIMLEINRVIFGGFSR